MSESYAICVIGVMDRLWFHQIILFPEPNPVLSCKTLTTTPLPISESFTNHESSIYSIPEDEMLSVASACLITTQQDESEKEEEIEKELELKERPTRSKVVAGKSRSQSSSPSTPKHSRKLKYSSYVTRLQKTMSCKSLSELEEEEVKGFIDLGFSFDKQNLCPRMMSVIPGLQRLGGGYKSEENDDEIEEVDDHEEKKGHENLRPYLSEAWLIKRPDSPLLNMRVPIVSTVADMKKHLRYWARTVASEIHQES